jgi:hypothetical protein
MDNCAESKEVDRLFEIVKARYGNRLDTEQLKEVRKGVAVIVETADTLASVKLTNSDEPFSVFKPYREE